MEPDDALRPWSVSLPDCENEDRVVGQPTTTMSSIIFPDYEEINDKFLMKRQGSRPKMNLSWSVLGKDQAEGVVKIPSHPKPLHLFSIPLRNYISSMNLNIHIERDRRSEQYLTVTPLVYGITPQESLAGTDQESEKRDSPFIDQTILRAGDKQDQFPTQTDEVTTPLTQFTQNIIGTSVVYSKTKSKNHRD